MSTRIPIALRLGCKQLRFELLAIGGFMAALGIGLVLLALRIRGADLAACSGFDQPGDCDARRAAVDGLVGLVVIGHLLSAIIPVFGALVLGVSVAAREIERGTALLAWSLSVSRVRWLASRSLVLGIMVLTASWLLAWLDEAVVRSGAVVELSSTFEAADLRAPVVAARALAAFALAVLAGALLGRSLPALLISIALAAMTALGIAKAMDGWATWQARPLEPDRASAARVVDTYWRLADGRVLTRDEFLALGGFAASPSNPGAGEVAPVPIGVDGARVGEYVAVQSSLLAVAGGLALAASAFVVERRRPY